jgi:hypothetical protein
MTHGDPDQHRHQRARAGFDSAGPSTSVASAWIVPGDPSGSSITSKSTPFSRLNDRATTSRPDSGCVFEITRTSHGSTARRCCSLSPSLPAPGRAISSRRVVDDSECLGGGPGPVPGREGQWVHPGSCVIGGPAIVAVPPPFSANLPEQAGRHAPAPACRRRFPRTCPQSQPPLPARMHPPLRKPRPGAPSTAQRARVWALTLCSRRFDQVIPGTVSPPPKDRLWRPLDAADLVGRPSMKRQRDCTGCGAAVGIIGSGCCCRCWNRRQAEAPLAARRGALLV